MADPSRTASVGDGLDGVKRVGLPASAHQRPAPPALRETLHPLADQALLKRCRGWRCGTIDTPTASAKHTLRAVARRWFALSVEIVDHARHLSRLTHPDLTDAA